MLFALAACHDEGFDKAFGIWLAGDIEITAYDCGDKTPPESVDPFELGVMNEWKSEIPEWADGLTARIFLWDDSTPYGEGTFRDDGLDVPPSDWLDSDYNTSILVHSVEHHATLVDDLVLDWGLEDIVRCEEVDAGGCDWWVADYPNDCRTSMHLTATWDRADW